MGVLIVGHIKKASYLFLNRLKASCRLEARMLGVNTIEYPKVSGLSHNEIYAYNNKHSLRTNTKGYGGRTH
jgi:hypothetical protein